MAHGIVGSKVCVELTRMSKTKALRVKKQYDLHATKGWRFYAKRAEVILVDEALVISIPCVNGEWHPRSGKRRLRTYKGEEIQRLQLRA